MMTGDVDAINERLNGLVNLLQVVGIDGVNPDALVEEQKRMNSSSIQRDSSAKMRNSSGSGTGSSDAQILEIIKKLQQAQADSPEILAALKSPELRALASLAAQKQAVSSKPKPPTPARTLDDVMDDDDNYPKIGPGYSDDISVVSDLTTPTVMTRQQVADEEFYRDVNGGPGPLPPMQIGGGMGPAQPTRNSGNGLAYPPHHGGKTKNMVGQVRPGAARRAIAKTGGAAAQRRLNYQMAMTKLQSSDSSQTDGFASPKKQKAAYETTSPTTTQDPMEFPSMGVPDGASSSVKKKSKSKKSKKTALAHQEVSDLDFEGTDPIRTPETSATSGMTSLSGSSSKKKSRDKINNSDLDWGTSDVNGWSAFDGASGRKNDIFVDSDGFFPNDAFSSNSGGGFGSSTPSASRAASSTNRRDESLGDKRISRDDGQVPVRKSSRLPKKENEGASEDRKKKEKPGKKKTRRASLSM